jgi:hypothetical protein
MWHIPNDLLPGPAIEESRDALDLSSPGVARRRSSHHSLSACVHADGERLTWQEHLLRTAVALAVGLLITWIVWL